MHVLLQRPDWSVQITRMKKEFKIEREQLLGQVDQLEEELQKLVCQNDWI